MKVASKLSAAEAVLRGRLMITLPTLMMMGCFAAGFQLLISPPVQSDPLTPMFILRAARLPLGGLTGAAIGWLWWSICVPRWRDWAKSNGADEEASQRLAVRTLLVWPKGWIFEKTEFHRKNRTR